MGQVGWVAQRDGRRCRNGASVARGGAHLVIMRWLLQKEVLHSVTASASSPYAWMQQW
jgi:hypothetical protein